MSREKDCRWHFGLESGRCVTYQVSDTTVDTRIKKEKQLDTDWQNEQE